MRFGWPLKTAAAAAEDKLDGMFAGLVVVLAVATDWTLLSELLKVIVLEVDEFMVDWRWL